MSAQAQKFGSSMKKKASLGVRSLCHPPIDDFMLTQVIRLHTFLESKKNNGISLYNSTSTKN